jgi:hypothetical protein
MLHQLITAHDAFQDGVLLFIALVVVANSAVLAHHLYEHKRWRETETGDRRHTGSIF